MTKFDVIIMLDEKIRLNMKLINIQITSNNLTQYNITMSSFL
jgi:hypothetical protein